MTAPQSSGNSPRQEYQRLLQIRQSALATLAKSHVTLGNLRVLVFFAGVVIGSLAFGVNSLSAWWLLAPIAAFWLVGARLDKLEAEQGALSRAVTFYERGLARLDGRWAGTGETGERFLDEHHLYAQDLDLFGRGSLFELLCTARTRMGEHTLAAWLLAPAAPDIVRQRQEAVTELSPRVPLRESLAVLAERAREGVHAEALAEWGEKPPLLRPSPFRIVARMLSVFGAMAALGLLAFTMDVFGLLSVPPKILAGMEIYFICISLLLAAVRWRFKDRVGQILHEVQPAAHDLDLVAGVLQRLESEQFTAPRLATLRAQLDTEGLPPSRRIAKLHTLIDLLDSREHRLMKMIGPLLLWDIHLCYAIEDWRRTSGPALRHWLEAVGDIEALSSFACYYHEHPAAVFPELLEEFTWFEGEGLCHPLLPEDRVVANDVRLGAGLRLLVVSGSNMSGKSTLLRTVGVNAVLAQAGAPVCAKLLRLSPMAVGSSIRTQDSLQENTSRFYAEITRLRSIMEKAETDAPVLFLLDELLNGTNSHDRRIGAEAIVRGLAELGAIGFITTHDLALAHIADALGPAGANVHFEDHMENGKMRFDYLMHPGVVQKSNAIELMRSVGLKV